MSLIQDTAKKLVKNFINNRVEDVKGNIKRKKRAVKLMYQRKTRGWDDSETWSFDRSLARVIVPRLKRFKELTIAVPSDMSEGEWNSILDRMIAAFEWVASEAYYEANATDIQKHQRGIDLFAEYYFNLWW